MTGTPTRTPQSVRHPAPNPAPSGASANSDPQAKLRAVHDRLTAAIGELTRAENWQLMLRTAARLPTYSPHNVLLITVQCPDATAVAGFHTWKQLGRAVRKGEKGIAILAPVLRRPDTVTPEAAPAANPPAPPPVTDGEQGTGRAVVGFRVVHVFDISQTNGPNLPEPPRPTLLDGQAPPGLLDGLTAQVADQGYQLIRHTFDTPHPGLDGPNGVTDFFARTVIVRPDLSDAQTSKTLAHELGHVLLHAPSCRPQGLTREQAEVEAESVAHVVADAHGLDTSRYTLPYVAGWSGGNLELLARSAERVIGTAHQILARTPAPPTFALPDATRQAVRGRPVVLDNSDRAHEQRRTPEPAHRLSSSAREQGRQR